MHTSAGNILAGEVTAKRMMHRQLNQSNLSFIPTTTPRGNITSNDNNRIDIFNTNETYIYITLALFIISVGIILNVLFIMAYYTIRSINQNQFNFELMQLSITFIVQGLGFSLYVLLDVHTFHDFARDVSGDSDSFAHSAVVYILCGTKDGMSVFFVATNCTIYILCSMTYTRYRLIKHPFSKLSTSQAKKRSSQLFVVFWIVSIIFLVPNYFTLYARQGLPFCLRTEFSFGIFLKIYGVLTLLIGNIVPFTFLVMIYGKVCYAFNHNRKDRSPCVSGEVSTINRTEITRRRYEKRAIRRLGFVVVTFVFYWTPLLCGWVLGFSGYYDLSIPQQLRKARMYRFVTFPCLFPAIVSVAGHVILNSKMRKSILKVSTRRARMATTGNRKDYLDSPL